MVEEGWPTFQCRFLVYFSLSFDTIQTIPTGEKTIVLIKDGYSTIIELIRIEEGQKTVLNKTLIRQDKNVRIGLGSPVPNSEASGLIKEWPFNFDNNQLSRLREVGCGSSDKNLTVAYRMAKRQFSAEDFVAAYEQASKMFLHGEDIEKVATFQFLNLPLDEFENMKSYGGITYYYNRRLPGRSMRIAGWVISGVGAISTIAGAAYLMDDPVTGVDDNAGYALLGIGIPIVIAGLFVEAAGLGNYKYWANDLDSAPKDEMSKYRLSPQKNKGTVKWPDPVSKKDNKFICGLSPFIALGPYKQSGLAFRMNF